MKNTIETFYPRLAALPEIEQLVTASFPHNAAAILQGMKEGADLEDKGELEELLTSFIIDHAEEIATYKGLGATSNSSPEAMKYLEVHHPEAHDLMEGQARELERLLGKDIAAVALGQKREPFTINILHWKGIYVVTAEDFETAWFDEEGETVHFAQYNFEPFITYAINEGKPGRKI